MNWALVYAVVCWVMPELAFNWWIFWALVLFLD